VARLIGFPKHSRMVGNALKVIPSHLASPVLPQIRPQPPPSAPNTATPTGPVASTSTASQPNPPAAPQVDDEDDEEPLPEPEPNPDFVPWHRVLATSGVISPRGSLAAVLRQADFLRAEGVEVIGAPERGDVRAGNGVLGHGGVDGGRVSMASYRWGGEEEP